MWYYIFRKIPYEVYQRNKFVCKGILFHQIGSVDTNYTGPIFVTDSDPCLCKDLLSANFKAQLLHYRQGPDFVVDDLCFVRQAEHKIASYTIKHVRRYPDCEEYIGVCHCTQKMITLNSMDHLLFRSKEDAWAHEELCRLHFNHYDALCVDPGTIDVPLSIGDSFFDALTGNPRFNRVLAIMYWDSQLKWSYLCDDNHGNFVMHRYNVMRFSREFDAEQFCASGQTHVGIQFHMHEPFYIFKDGLVKQFFVEDLLQQGSIVQIKAFDPEYGVLNYEFTCQSNLFKNQSDAIIDNRVHHQEEEFLYDFMYETIDLKCYEQMEDVEIG